MADDGQLDRLAALLRQADQIVVLTGAGISTESGIPDFRGPKGVWTRNPAAEKQSTIQNYLAEPEVRKAAWRSRLDSPAWRAEPNAGHRALVALERRGKLHALITQNIDELHQRAGSSPDRVVEVHGSMRRVMCWECGRRAPMEEALARVRAGEDDPHCRDCSGILHALVTQNIDELHQRAGSSPDRVVEVHGSMRRVMCWECGRRAPMEEALARVRAGEADPHCLACGGILKSDTISFGQALVPEVIDRAMSAAAEADLMLAIGTTLQVQPVASMVPIAARAGAQVVIVNDQPTAMDSIADVVIRAPIGAVLTTICGAAASAQDSSR